MMESVRRQGGGPKEAWSSSAAGGQAAQAMAPVQEPEVSLGDAAAAPGEEADSEITLEQFTEQLRRIDKTLRALPATAQARPLAPLLPGVSSCIWLIVEHFEARRQGAARAARRRAGAPLLAVTTAS